MDYSSGCDPSSHRETIWIRSSCNTHEHNETACDSQNRKVSPCQVQDNAECAHYGDTPKFLQVYTWQRLESKRAKGRMEIKPNYSLFYDPSRLITLGCRAHAHTCRAVVGPCTQDQHAHQEPASLVGHLDLLYVDPLKRRYPSPGCRSRPRQYRQSASTGPAPPHKRCMLPWHGCLAERRSDLQTSIGGIIRSRIFARCHRRSGIFPIPRANCHEMVSWPRMSRNPEYLPRGSGMPAGPAKESVNVAPVTGQRL